MQNILASIYPPAGHPDSHSGRPETAIKSGKNEPADLPPNCGGERSGSRLCMRIALMDLKEQAGPDDRPEQ
jgi:hypothetical protein